MGWIKRNLFFVIGGVVALGLLGAAGFYIYKNWTRNSEAYDKLSEVVQNLQNLAQQKPSPGNEKINNTTLAKEQEHQLWNWNKSVGVYFQPIAPIPAEGPVQSESYAAGLRRTVDELQHEAEAGNIILPPKYDFSFTAQRSLVKFANGSLESLAVQLGEVKAICEILFAARINALDDIQRVRVSADDASGPQSDYLEQSPVINEYASITPYVLTFRSFTPELSRVISGFATCSNAIIIKSVNIQPAGTALAAQGNAPSGMPGLGMPAATPAQPQPAASKGGLQTVLKEQLLRVTMELELVKLLPKS